MQSGCLAVTCTFSLVRSGRGPAALHYLPAFCLSVWLRKEAKMKKGCVTGGCLVHACIIAQTRMQTERMHGSLMHGRVDKLAGIHRKDTSVGLILRSRSALH
mmetsp:Transcript_31065/g.61242  ORF Transcript_31065/g.61242 Transcript_31065/m.61242 type:complete len:102 (+) Transcript_31065:1971-2276(+)